MIEFYGTLSVVSFIASALFLVLSVFLFFHLRIPDVIQELNGDKDKRIVSGLLNHTFFANTRIRKGTKEYEEMTEIIKKYFAKSKEQQEWDTPSFVLGGVAIDSNVKGVGTANQVFYTNDLPPITEVLSSNTGVLVEKKYRLKELVHERYRLTKRERQAFELLKTEICVSTNEKIYKKRGLRWKRR